MNLVETYVLDGIDLRVLDELQRDSKRSLKEIGASVGLSAPSVMERVRKLESAGIIKGYLALLDDMKVGLDVAAFIGVSILSPKQLSAFEEWVDSIPQVMECHHVTGGHTLLLKVKTQNTKDLEGLISRIDDSLFSLLVEHLKDIRDEAQAFDREELAARAERLLKPWEQPEE